MERVPLDGVEAKLIQLTERYCVVFQTLSGAPALSVDWQRTPSA